MNRMAETKFGVDLILADSQVVPVCHSEERSDDPDGIGVVWSGSTHAQIPLLPPKIRIELAALNCTET